MKVIKLGSKKIQFPGEEVYVIAEIGQNHQGCIEIAKKMILEAKRAGCDCVKFQKSCLNEKFNKGALDRIYNGVNSWGSTYGEHKNYLEFDLVQYYILQEYCRNVQIDFTASAMDVVSLNELYSMNVPFIKIGSGDTNNFPLIEKASKLNIPLIISTGMQSMKTIERVNSIMIKAKKEDFVFLHCVSSYPTYPNDCNLSMIPKLHKKFSNIIIGYSGHELGLEITQAAVLLGARVVERHFTLDKKQKGTDHKCSLEPQELKTLVDNILTMKRNGQLYCMTYQVKDILNILKNNKDVEDALQGYDEKSILKCELPCKRKLGKSLVSAASLKRGEFLQYENVKVKVCEPNGIPAENYYEIIGRIIKNDIEEDSPIMLTDLESE